MNDCSSHALSRYDEDGEGYWVTQFKSDQGIENVELEEAKRLAGENPHDHREDRWAAIEGRNPDVDAEGPDQARGGGRSVRHQPFRPHARTSSPTS